MNRKEFKGKARKSLLKNYFNCIFVCIIMLFMVGSYTDTKTAFTNESNYINTKYNVTFRNKLNIIDTSAPEGGILKYVYDGAITLKKQVKKFTIASEDIQNGNNKTITMLLISIVFTMLIMMFIIGVIKVGESRFFLENRNYNKTNVSRIFYGFKKGRYINTVTTKTMVTIYELLWWFTIIGGIIKHYSYYMVDFIISENPSIDHRTAIKLSRDMMNGYKLKTLLFDISFLGWHILNIFTFGLVGILYLNPYSKAAKAELYVELRNKAKKKKISNTKLLNDEVLYKKTKEEYYPGCHKFQISVKKDYYKKYSLVSYIIFFFIFSMIGWLWEVILVFVRSGFLVNRGTMHGPWLPIYGWGCVIVLLLLLPKKLKKILDNPIYTMLLIMFIFSILEYFTGLYLEVFNCMKYWDYSGYFMNINGRICLECTMFFGLGGCLCIYIVAPLIDKFINKVKKEYLIMICIILIPIFTIDFIYSTKFPNHGDGITNYQTQVINEKCNKKADK